MPPRHSYACLNRTLGNVNLYLPKTKPFDVIAEGLSFKKSRGERIRTFDPLLPKQVR